MRQFLFLTIAAFFIASCSSEHLYDKVGFEPGAAPNNPDPRINKTAPDYYYRAAPTVPQGYAPPQQTYYAPPQQQGYAPQPYTQQGYVQQGYAPQQGYAVPQQQPVPYQQVGGSRYYSNPYAIPAAPYSPAYDTDQYYVAPNAYYGAEPTPKQGRDGPAMRY